MFRCLQQIAQIKSYTARKGVAIKEGLIFDLKKNIVVSENSNKQVEIFDFGESYLITNDIRGNSTIVNINNLSLDQRFKINAFSYPFLVYYTQAEPRKYSVYNYRENKLNFESYEWIGRHIINDSLYSSYQDVICKRSVYHDDVMWCCDLKELLAFGTDSNQEKNYEVRKFIGIWKNYLLILLSNNELLILDKDNGTFIKRINKIPPQKMAEYTIDFLGNCMELDEQTGKLKGFVNFVFWEFDLSNFNFDCFNLENTLVDNNLNSLMNITSYGHSDEHYFVTMFKIDDTGSMVSYLVALNNENKNIDWVSELPWTGVNVPQYANGKLYQLDNNNTLHIFEQNT